jgi:antitoxin MazE
MEIKAQMWGNSLAIRLPKPLAKDCGIRPDDTLDARIEDGHLVIRKGKPTLDQLLGAITPENLQSEVSFGPPVGKESL